jgi:hypothetical protein
MKADADMARIDSTAATRLIAHGKKRVLYLGKVKEALEAGYVIVPNMPGDTIAIRVKRENPRQSHQLDKPYRPSVHRENPDLLPSGQGDYVKPLPTGEIHTNVLPDGKKTFDLLIGDFDDEIGLPVQFMKPTLVKRLGEALDLKIFDEIEVVNGHVDPLIVGHVIERTSDTRKRTSFLIAWFVNTADI